ncbi:MAG TPA: hypothetical protein VJ796_03875 [Acidimicrobiia bacterium]|nr:hypothetical protein [Acidimicrobiia bacterium]
MNFRRLRLLGMVVVAAVACQSGTAETSPPPTDNSEVVTTEAPADPGSVGSVDDMPAECVDALREYLQAIEPVVEGIDFQSLTQTDFEALSEELATATEGFEERTESCPDLDVSTTESFSIIREFAEEEAPGTVAYFTFIEDFVRALESGGNASGDCESDIAAFQEFVDRGGSMADLTATEVAEASTLMSSIGANCSDERFQEWSQDEEIQAWISG